MNNHISLTEFMSEYGHRLVRIAYDDCEYGDYRLTENQKKKVESLMKYGFTAVTIWEAGDDQTEETVSFEYENSASHPFVTGYFLLQPVFIGMLSFVDKSVRVFDLFTDPAEKNKWHAYIYGGKDVRIIIRRHFKISDFAKEKIYGSSLKIVVYQNPEKGVTISRYGEQYLSYDQFNEMVIAVKEAELFLLMRSVKSK